MAGLRGEDNKCVTFAFDKDIVSYSGSSTYVDNFSDMGKKISIYRITSWSGTPTFTHWPGDIICIENQTTTDYQFNWRCIRYGDTVATGSNILGSGTESIWQRWWSMWIFTSSNCYIMMASG